MKRIELKSIRRNRRRKGLRKRVLGSPDRPRLSVFRSGRHIYAQLIDDVRGVTLASASTGGKGSSGGGNCAAAETVGTAIAERAGAAGIKSVVFDRNGYKYHGRVKALADAARKGGLEF